MVNIWQDYLEPQILIRAPTALIAKEAGITYFETKTALLNQLYVELKTE